MRKRVLGFTLIELMIVIAIIAIIAAIAIPGLLRARMSANEGSASASLRSLASAQASFAKANSVDQDQDGQGEYGTFNELTGTSFCRVNGTINGGVGVAKIAVGDMSVALAATAVTSNDGSGIAAKSGFYYHLYLPGVISDEPAGGALAGYDNLGTTDENNAIQQQENRWICYAWPATFKSSGMRAFVCDNSAEVYASANTQGDVDNTPVYDGTKSASNEPAYNDAMRNETGMDAIYWTNICVRDKANAVLADSHLWVPSQ